MRILLVRYGAWGDSIIITPLIRFLKSQGHEIFLHTSETGMKVLAGNPHIDKVIPYVSNSVPDDKLVAYWEKLAKDYRCDKIINMCESIERAISFHPIDPVYNYTKEERRKRGNKNFYEYAFEHAGFPLFFDFGRGVQPRGSKVFWQHCDSKTIQQLRPELFFTEMEEEKMQKFFAGLKDKIVILWGLSGSGLNKTYPYTDFVIGDVLRSYPNAVVITVGDELCQALEIMEDERVIRKSGRWSMREASLACKYADIVVAPDTGLLHAAGCFDTPKIGLIGSNTIENITKHFKNDFSLEANPDAVPCAPCFRLIYSASTQCPIEESVHLPKCMAIGIDPKLVLERIDAIIQDFAGHKMSGMSAISVG